MGKKQQQKDEAPNPNSIANRDIFQRLNFLYQASAYLKGLEAPRSAAGLDVTLAGARERSSKGTSRKKNGKRRCASLGELGSSYVRCMRVIGNKTVVRMDPNVKRTLCKCCDTVLVPGTTTSVRVKASPTTGQKVSYTCLECHTSRVILAPPVASSGTVALSSNPPPEPASSTSLQDTLEIIQTPAPEPTQAGKQRKRNRLVARPLPLFARPDAGHVVFRGSEMLSEAQ